MTEYRIATLKKPINLIYNYRINKIIRERGKPVRTEEYQLCRTLHEAQAVLSKLNKE